MRAKDPTLAPCPPDIRIRPYEPRDTPKVLEVFQTAITQGAARCYDAAQREAWAAGLVEVEAMATRLTGLEVWVAVRAESDQVVGFMTLAPSGHIDFAYVAPTVMGQGVAQALYEVVEPRARAAALARLITEASHLARRFFACRGWQVDRAARVQRAGVTLENFAMSKPLGIKNSAG
ncbi:putative N-acetyltransferase YafP [Roseovarius gaetbuli]|uniref:Putative N-acetyltransferase YafP n=1 Tax=Roseovarius gaetbuli TaxID=1356575 RepID=A0A1X6Y639_9RHOB|nr:GNAT family N-acetyltransferase [Roseovarius gaetbuli]SLN11503.1 putative N-acetyltransferase YafP [Roseovarius gaetbuli]